MRTPGVPNVGNRTKEDAIISRYALPVVADHDKVLCVQVFGLRVFGLIEVEPGRHGFGFSHTHALARDVAPPRLGDALHGPGSENMAGLPPEWR